VFFINFEEKGKTMNKMKIKSIEKARILGESTKRLS